MTSGENSRAATSKLQGDLNFAFDQRESEVNLHKATSSPESPSNVSTAIKYYYLIVENCDVDNFPLCLNTKFVQIRIHIFI